MKRKRYPIQSKFKKFPISVRIGLQNPVLYTTVVEADCRSGLRPEFGFWGEPGAGVNILGSSRSRSQFLKSSQEPIKIFKGPVKIYVMRFVVKLNEIS